MKNSALNILKKAHRLLRTRGWCRRVLARDKHGMSVSSDSPEACCFCAVGALDLAGLRCNGVTEFARARDFLRKAIDPTGKWVYIGDWNDVQKNRLPVLAAFRRAIKLAKSA